MAILRAGTEHRYQLCRDDDCDRFPCRVYKEGHRDGFGAGWEQGWIAGYVKGYQDGYRKGYDAGYPDGMAACPLPHG